MVLVAEDESVLRLHAIDIVEEVGFAAIERNVGKAIAILEARSDINLLFTDICRHDRPCELPTGVSAVMNGDPAAKQRFLEQAKALSERPEFVRYLAVTQLICDALAFGIRDEAEVFFAAYDDPKGKEYWEAYLSVAIPVLTLANLLSAHSSKNIEELENRRFATLRAFRGAAEAGEPWFVGITNPILVVEEFGQTPDGLSKVRVQPRAAVEWLLSKSIFKHLVPESLQLFLQDETIMAATTEKLPKALDTQLPVGNSPRERAAQPRKKSRPAFGRARRVIEKLYPDGVPDQATVSNKSLCKQVNEKLKEMGQQSVSQDTVERAAGRRK